MSIQCPECHAIAGRGFEIAHRTDCSYAIPMNYAPDRVNKLYISNTSAQWAKEQLNILIHMIDTQNPLHNVTSSIKASPWVYMELIRIRDGIRTVDG